LPAISKKTGFTSGKGQTQQGILTIKKNCMDCHVDWPWLQGPSPRDCGWGTQNIWLKSSKDSDKRDSK